MWWQMTAVPAADADGRGNSGIVDLALSEGVPEERKGSRRVTSFSRGGNFRDGVQQCVFVF
jgi:hypothetical protein